MKKLSLLIFFICFSLFSAQEKVPVFKLPRTWKEDASLLKKNPPGLLFAAFREKKGEAFLALSVYRIPASGKIQFDEKIMHETFLREKEVVYCVRRESVRAAGESCMRSIFRLKNNVFAETWAFEHEKTLWNVLFTYDSDANYEDMKEIERIVSSAVLQSREAKE